jgi:hypothetical protein
MNNLTQEQIIQFLFELLDDIDSQSDACKENDKAYRRRVEQLQKERFRCGITTDGYDLYLPCGKKLPKRVEFRL